MDPVTAVKVGLLVKKHWKIILGIVIGIPVSIMLIPIIIIIALYPSADDNTVEQYKTNASLAGISWVELLILDTVKHDNEFDSISSLDRLDSVLDFYIIEEKEYEIIYEENIIDTSILSKDIKNISMESNYGNNNLSNQRKLKSSRTYIGSNGVKQLLKKHGYHIDENISIINVNKNLQKINDNELIDLNITHRDFEEVIDFLNEEQKTWALELFADNTLIQMYDEDETIVLPGHINVDGKGLFEFPTPDLKVITSPFGWRIDPINGQQKYHKGVDISGYKALGKLIIAVEDGRIIEACHSTGYAGNYITIEHCIGGEKWLSKYLHLNQINVSTNQQVKRGDVIGAVGNTGRSTGAHLHFELYYEKQVVNPLEYINK